MFFTDAHMFLVWPLLIFLAAIFIRNAARRASKTCPKCAEPVKREALVCRCCRYEFGPADDPRIT